jgi:hypothetical protein
MPTDHILALLIEERDKLTRAIETLQGPTLRRGRPPKNASAIAATTPAATNHKRGMSSAARKVQSRRMKAYWAAKRRKQSTSKNS